MDLTMVILRLVHIFSAVIWTGAAFTMVLFIGPTVQALGAEAQKFIQHFTLRGPFQRAMAATAGLPVLSGLIMYYRLFRGLAPLNTGSGFALTVGALVGLAAMGDGIGMGRRVEELRGLSQEIAASGGKPDPEQEQMASGGARSALFLAIALAGMTLSEYFAF